MQILTKFVTCANLKAEKLGVKNMGETNNSKTDFARLICYLALNNEEMNAILSRDYLKPKKQGLTTTFYSADSTREIVYRLMDNRDFKEQAPEEREKMIFTNYYPKEAKQLESVYLDDRRNLCQEFHNRLCASLKIPSTQIVFSDFKNSFDSDMFEYYDPLSGIIFLNTNLFNGQDDILQVLISLTQSTLKHQVQYKLKTMYKNFDDFSNREKYVCLSALAAECALAELTKSGAKDDRRGYEACSDYSALEVYATEQSFEILENLFTELGLSFLPEIKDFIEEKKDFLLSLSGEDINDNNLIMDDEDEEEYERDAILNTTLCRDYTMLQEIMLSTLNQKTDGDLFEVFIGLLSENADEFYETYNFPIDARYKVQFRDFLECEEAEESDENSF